MLRKGSERPTKLERETAGGVIVELLGDPRVGDVLKEDMRAFGLTVARLPAHVHKRYPPQVHCGSAGVDRR